MGACTELETIKAARKQHRCSWCAEHIAAGDTYIRWRWFDGGDANTVKMHPECVEAMERFLAEWGDDDFLEGAFSRGCCCEHGNCLCSKPYASDRSLFDRTEAHAINADLQRRR